MFDSYITKEWYRGTYPSVNKFTGQDAELDAAIFDASRIIDDQTHQRATCFDDMTEDEQTAIKYAVGAQVDYIAGVGFDPESVPSSDYNGGFSIGKYSENAKSGDARAQDVVSPKVLRYLRACNLTNPGFKDRRPISRHTFGGGINGETDFQA